MSGNGEFSDLANSRKERGEQPDRVQVREIESAYDYFAVPGGENMRGAIWMHLSNLPEKLHAVDLNSQGGDLARFVSDFEIPEKIYIVDNDADLTRRENKDLLERPEIVVAQQDPLTFEPLDPVDLVICNTMLRMVPAEEKESALKRIYDYMKQGGKFMWSDLIVPEQPEQLEAMLQERRDRLASSGFSASAIESFFQKETGESHPITPESMRTLLERVGFKEITEEWQEGMFVLLSAVK